MKKIIQLKTKYIFIIIFLINIAIYIPFILGHYSTDLYNIINVGYENYAINWFLKDGRIISALMLLIANMTNLRVQTINIISIILAIIINTISIMTIYKISMKYKNIKENKDKIILALISYIIICNFMYVENMYFIESSIMALSILFYILSAKIMVEKKKYSNIFSVLLAILGCISYQGTIEFLLVFVGLLTFVKNKKEYKKNIKDILKGILITLIAGIINLIIVNIIGIKLNTANTRITNIFGNILNIINYGSIIFKYTCNLYPKYLFIIMLIIVEIMLLNYIIKKRENTNIFYKSIILIIISLLSAFIPSVISSTAFYAGRIHFSIGSLIGILFLYLYIETDIFKEKVLYKNIAFILLSIYVITTIISNIGLMYENKLVNKLEKEACEKIISQIESYEEETKNKIEKIQTIVIQKQTDKSYFKQTKHKCVLTYNAISANWSAVGAINYYIGRNLVEMNREIKQEDLEKIVQNPLRHICMGDTLYVKCYMY